MYYIEPQYRLVDSNGWETRYVKENPTLGIRTWMIFEHKSGKMIIRKTQRVDHTLDVNHEQRANGYKRNAPMRQVARIPLVEHRKLLERCGLENGEYDQAKFNAFLDDSDYKRLKTIDGKIGRPSRMV